ncbi:MAG: hypothetical protein FWD04_01935 [Conexibacteraceae bacterium]|nr:hypothetical protein [Conexibacteraceae bacterium]
MTEPDTNFELVDFEQVEAAPGTALLRVTAHPSAAMGNGPLALVIKNGEQEHRHEQLPALPGPPGLIRTAFSAPAAQVVEGATYALALPDGQAVPLPAPAQRRAAMATGPGAAATPVASGPPAEESESSRLVEAERQAESRRLAITELERRLQSERERRSAAESDLAQLRSERDGAVSEREAALAERDEAVADRDQAEARARAAAANAGTLEAQVRAAADAATRTQAALEAELADRVSELERTRDAAQVAQARAHASRIEATTLDEQLAHAQAQLSVLQRALDEHDAAPHAHAEHGDADHETLRQHNAELESTLAELDHAMAARAAEIDLLRQAVADGNEKRKRAEEALVSASAEHALRTESLALEAERRNA